MELEEIADYACDTGEGPLWHPVEKALYWLDIHSGRIFRYNPNTGSHSTIHEGEPLGGMTIEADGSLLLFQRSGIINKWTGDSIEVVNDELKEEPQYQFNDVIADPMGRVFCGTLATEDSVGKLYRLDTDGSIEAVYEGVETSNGLGFSPDYDTLYFTESRKQRISEFGYDVGTGAISNRRTFVETPEDGGLPDGMTVDKQGGVWSAQCYGGHVVRYSKDGSVERRIDLPVTKVTSLIHGGPSYRDLYVTTGGGQNKKEQGDKAGTLFRFETEVSGRPEHFSRITI